MSLEKTRRKYIYRLFNTVILIIFFVFVSLRVVRVNDNVNFSGVIKSRDITSVNAPCDTYLREVYFLPGEKVKAGAIMAKVDGFTINSLIQGLESQVIEGENRRTDIIKKRDTIPYRISVMEQDIIECQARLENAEQRYKANEGLHQEGLISVDELRRLRYDYVLAKSNLVQLENNLKIYKIENGPEVIQKINEEVKTLNSQLTQLRKQIAEFKQKFIFKKNEPDPFIIAPKDGVITAIANLTSSESAGEMLRKATNFGGAHFEANETILEISDPNNTYIEGEVRERDFPFIYEGDRVNFTLAAYPYQKYGVFEGVIDKLYMEPLGKNGEAVYKCEIRLINVKSNTAIRTYLGLTTFVTVDVRRNYNLLEYMAKKIFEDESR